MISIRVAIVSDATLLQDLFLQLGYQTKCENLESQLKRESDNRCTLVAVSGKNICGVIVINFIIPVHEEGLWGVISALVIDEVYRGKRIGQRLLTEVESIAKDKMCTHIELSSSEVRTKAHKFYESNGFKEVRKRFVKQLK
ncbi:aminoalkylphosphonic acid N-acetyltransferase [Yersinia intermedia]|jgi:ribosomal protein S18 acetylase RimI-like enzyme|uniref:GNAT family N-acetyltransferase n=1 Tax=Yersinia intermedia TaxID=631 RepID=A0ABX6FB30_YERIN|nr:GNAT family N-acetyltransferase [Yersinia intermedia]QGR66084.1 GNAT family N-acetyltransferase [Yersinia intermedia]QGR71101.1 GNAT family N-acetyltransferase [Yersinia intermedia]CRY75659.1 aminoalkylphosphonic acid N-acetyltransferase [Yersinia intermedia]VDZ55788.1 aminoalkylphosphonic acid N-acetyltransferase [Yersinia intermedia]